MSFDIRAIARALGGDVAGPNQVTCPGPGHSKHDRSLSVVFSSTSVFTVHSFAGDPWPICKDHVARLLGVPQQEWRSDLRAPRMPAPAPSDHAQHHSAFALRIWQTALPPILSPVQRYLEGRNLQISTTPLAYGDTIRFLPACPFMLKTGGRVRLPAMVTLFRDVLTNEPRAIHRTALAADGSGKAKMKDLEPRQMLGPVKNCAIKLSDDSEVTAGLTIAEGLENALTAYMGGLRPVWALGSAGAIRTFPVVPGIGAITILADHDRAGLEAARECGRRWADAGREVTIAYPPRQGADWNDLQREAS